MAANLLAAVLVPLLWVAAGAQGRPLVLCIGGDGSARFELSEQHTCSHTHVEPCADATPDEGDASADADARACHASSAAAQPRSTAAPTPLVIDSAVGDPCTNATHMLIVHHGSRHALAAHAAPNLSILELGVAWDGATPDAFSLAAHPALTRTPLDLGARGRPDPVRLAQSTIVLRS